MSHFTSHAQRHLAGIDMESSEMSVLADSMPVLATPAAFAAGAGVVVGAGVAGFVAEEVADD